MALRSAVSHVPLYLQVEATLKEMIEGAAYSPGEQIPSERDLAEELGVSRMTVRRAVESLIQRGLLERRSTNGTYVRHPQVLRRVGEDVALGLTQMLRQEGAAPGSVLLAFEELRAPLKIAEKLDLRLGSPVVMIRRLRTANDLPFCLETSYLPRELVPDLQAADLEGNASLYGLMQARYGVRFAKNDETIKITFATSEEAGLLGLDEGDSVMLLRSVVTDEDERPVEYLKSVNHPARVMFHSKSTLSRLGLKPVGSS